MPEISRFYGIVITMYWDEHAPPHFHAEYRGKNMLRPKIFQVVPTDDYKVYVYFDDGRIKLYDAKPLIDKGEIFKKIEDISIFINTCTILNNTLAWDITGDRNATECIDICPDTLYYHCPDVKEVDIPLFKEFYDKTNNYSPNPGS